jgi:hypothetical protein
MLLKKKKKLCGEALSAEIFSAFWGGGAAGKYFSAIMNFFRRGTCYDEFREGRAARAQKSHKPFCRR